MPGAAQSAVTELSMDHWWFNPIELPLADVKVQVVKLLHSTTHSTYRLQQRAQCCV